MKNKIIFVSIILILAMLIMCLYIHINSEDGVNINYSKTFEENMDKTKEETINDEIDKRYQLYRKDLSKYRIGIPKRYKDLNNRIHVAPSPSDVHVSTLKKGCNPMYFEVKDTSDYVDLMNPVKKIAYIDRNRYESR